MYQWFFNNPFIFGILYYLALLIPDLCAIKVRVPWAVLCAMTARKTEDTQLHKDIRFR
jgi:hypothetical protein